MKRLSWEEYALKIAEVAAERSEDIYLKVGSCCLRHDNSCAGIGYNGPPAGIEIDWSNRDERRKRIIHSEINCLRYCKPGECYLIACTLLPCNSCLTVISSYGIKKIVYRDIYDKDDSTLKLAAEFGIELVNIKKAPSLNGASFSQDIKTLQMQNSYFISPGLQPWMEPLPKVLHIGRKVKVIKGGHAGRIGIITDHWFDGDDCSGSYGSQIYQLEGDLEKYGCKNTSYGIKSKDCEFLDIPPEPIPPDLIYY